MKRTFLLFYLSLVFLVFLKIQAFPVTSPKIEANAFLNKKSYLVGEPIYLTLEFKNKYNTMIELKTRLAYSYGDVKISIMKPNQLPVDYKGIYEASIYPYYIFEVYPNLIERITLMILYSDESNDGLIFNRPGKAAISFSLKAMIGDQTVDFSFPVFPIEITAPTDMNLQAFKALRLKSLFRDINMTQISPDNMVKFEKFLKEYPYSAYTPYILYLAACSYMSKIGNREPDFQQAIKLFKLYISLYPDSVLEDDAVYKIAESYHKLKDVKTAKRWFVKLYNQYPDTSRVNHYDPLMKEYIFTEKVKMNPNLWMLYDPFDEQTNGEMEGMLLPKNP